MEACTSDLQLNGKESLSSPFMGKKMTSWLLITCVILCLCVGAHMEVQVLVETRKGCWSPWCWSSRYWTQSLLQDHTVSFPVPSPRILQGGTSEDQGRKITWPELVFIANKYENQKTGQASAVDFRGGVLSVSSGGRCPWHASPRESHAPNPCPSLALSSRNTC